jgi:hypothetical protein
MRRGALAAACAIPLLAAPLIAVGARAAGTNAFDATNLRGGCTALELTVKTGYSFIVQPDVQMPRAGTAIQEGLSEAIASPVDPGDSVDGLAALGIPQAESYLANGYPGAPSPFAGQGLNKLPPPLNSAGQTLVQNPFNQTLTYPYEHADAGYPNAQRPGTQTATLAGTPNVALTDPSGVFTLNATTARAVAGDGIAVADGGAGAAASAATPTVPLGVGSLPALGVSVGRVSAHSEAHVLADRVTEDAVCTLNDVEIAVPGAVPVHIGAVVATVHAERGLGAAPASATETIEFAGVTVNGQGATLDQNGLQIGGHTVTTLPSGNSPSPPPGVPLPSSGPVPPPPSVSFAGTSVARQQPSPDEAVIAATGATVTVSSTTPIPNAIPPTGISDTPTVYTLHIASLAGEAYGLAASAPASSGFGVGAVAGGVAGILGAGLGAFSSPPSNAGATHTHPGTAGQPDTLASVVVTPVQRGIILAVSSLLEALLLAGVARNYLRSRRRIAAPAETTDLP